eukprot:TRINITY_DN896_c0_g1_i6.p1 TRINITY_DN896_c0_g1~~TRINITY_DN896_c0_g1_i6.p1  ORF type:complete len:132 (+),score=13.64 TRINITY_DN896_c0_g1_i6:219-614(+)
MLFFFSYRKKTLNVVVTKAFIVLNIITGFDQVYLNSTVEAFCLRKTQDATHFKLVTVDGQQKYVPCSSGDKAAEAHTLQEFAKEGKHQMVIAPKINMRDFEKVLDRARPSVAPSDLEEYENFTKEFGEDGS